eukprot:1127497-Prymnesium_polylepis.1
MWEWSAQHAHLALHVVDTAAVLVAQDTPRAVDGSKPLRRLLLLGHRHLVRVPLESKLAVLALDVSRARI